MDAAVMIRAACCALMIGAGGLTACGGDGGSSSEPNRATGIAPPSAGPPAAAVDWTMPTGVFRSDTPEGHVLEAHIDAGTFQQYDVTDGSPDLGYSAECVADDPSTVTCTERDGHEIVFAWSGSSDRLVFSVVAGQPDERRVLEGAPWVRLP